MKIRLMLLISLIITIPVFTVYAADDDCPCRKKPKPAVVVKKKPAPAPVRVFKTNPLFDDNFRVPENTLCPGSTMSQKENVQLKVMPNPVRETLNVIYNTSYTASVKIEILDCDGSVLKVLMNEVQPEGLKVRSFDVLGKVRPGIAFIRVSAGSEVLVVEKIFKL
jgi:hypothetical protein